MFDAIHYDADGERVCVQPDYGGQPNEGLPSYEEAVSGQHVSLIPVGQQLSIATRDASNDDSLPSYDQISR